MPESLTKNGAAMLIDQYVGEEVVLNGEYFIEFDRIEPFQGYEADVWAGEVTPMRVYEAKSTEDWDKKKMGYAENAPVITLLEGKSEEFSDDNTPIADELAETGNCGLHGNNIQGVGMKAGTHRHANPDEYRQPNIEIGIYVKDLDFV